MAKKHQQDDKLMTAYYKAADFFENHKKHVYTALTILVIVIAGIYILVQRKKSNNEIAAIELEKLKNVYVGNDFVQAINGDSLGMTKGLQYIVDEYGSTESGEMAKIMLANSYYALRDFDKAEKYFRDYSGDNKILQVAASAGIASVYDAKNNYKEAAEQYEKTASMDNENPFIDQYLFYAAKNYFRANDFANARRLFDKLKEDYPKSKYNSESLRYTSSINEQ